jgi:raffinose/stachyose/melibiose transport system permease protein
VLGRETPRTRLAAHAGLVVLTLPFLVPMLVVLGVSLRGERLHNYTAVITETPFLRFMLNSLIIAGGTVALVYVCTMLAGFAFAKLRFRGRSLLFNALVLGLVLPTISLLVPLFVVIQQLGLFDSYLAVIVPLAAITTPFTLLLVRNYMISLPDELVDAARVDGCGDLRALLLVVLPLARPISAVVVVWTFLASWNEFFLPLLFLQDPDRQAVTQVPLYFASTYGSDVPKIFASLVLISLPVVVAYLLLQRFFERGITGGALK